MITPEYSSFRRTPPSPIIVLATPCSRDMQFLREVVGQHGVQPVEAATDRAALTALANFGASAVFCDESLHWRDLLSYIAEDMVPPRVVVVASAPPASLWAEVLSLGGFDVLSKPFLQEEVQRILRLSCSLAGESDQRQEPVPVPLRALSHSA